MLRNVGSNWIITAVMLVAAYVLTPFTVHTLGDAGYGTWNLINSITGYLALLILGVPMASVRYFAQHVAEGDIKELNRAIASCTAMYLALGAAALLIGAGLYVFFTVTYQIPPVLRVDAHRGFALIVLYIALGFVGQLPEGVLAAHDDFVPRNMVRFAGVLLRFGLTFGVLSLWPSLTALALVQLVCLAFDFSLCVWLIKRRHPGARISLADFDWTMVRRILSFSLYVLLLQAGLRLSFETDSLVIGAFLNVSAIAFFAIGSSFIGYLMDFITSIGAVVMPTARRLKTQGREAELRGIFLKWSKISLSLTLGVGLFLMVLGPRFIGWWIDPAFERPAGQVLRILMLSSFVFLPVRAVALAILMGLGKPAVPAIGLLIAGLLNVGLSIALARPLGLAGVAIGTAIPNVLYAAAVLVQACRELETPVAGFLRYVVPRAALGAVPALALLLWFRLGLDVRTFAGLASAGVAMVLLFVLTWVFFVYRNDPYVDVSGYVARLRGKAWG